MKNLLLCTLILMMIGVQRTKASIPRNLLSAVNMRNFNGTESEEYIYSIVMSTDLEDAFKDVKFVDLLDKINQLDHLNNLTVVFAIIIGLVVAVILLLLTIVLLMIHFMRRTTV